MNVHVLPKKTNEQTNKRCFFKSHFPKLSVTGQNKMILITMHFRRGEVRYTVRWFV